MGGLSLWVRADWRRRWLSLLALAVLVAVAGGVATALLAGAHRADTAMARFHAETGPYNLVAEMSLGEHKPESDEELDELLDSQADALAAIAREPGVESISVESWWGIRLLPEYDPPGTVGAFAIGTFSERGDRYHPLVLDGTWPEPDDPDAVVVNEDAVRLLGWTVGSRQTFDTVSPGRMLEWFGNDAQLTDVAGLDGPRIEVEVAAVVRHEADLVENDYPGMLFPEGFARAHADDIAHLEPFALIRADPSRIDEVRERIEAVISGTRVSVADAPPLGEAAPAVIPTVGVEVITLRIAAIVAAVAGLFVVAQAAGRQLAATAGEDRVRFAIGMTTSQQVLGKLLALAPGIIVGAAAVPIVAWALSGVFPRGLARKVEPSPGPRFETSIVLIGATCTAVITLILVATMATAALRRHRSQSVPRAARARGLLAHPALSLGMTFAADPTGTGRSRLGTWAAVATVALGVTAVLTVATLDDSRDNLMSTPALYGAIAEYQYSSNGTLGVADVAAAATDIPGVSAVTHQLMINDDSMPAVGTRQAEVEPEALDTLLGGALPPLHDGRLPAGPDEVALGRGQAAALGVGLGDEVRIAPLGTSTPLMLEVTGITVSPNDDDPDHEFVVTVPTLQALICGGDDLAVCNLTADVFVDVGDGTEGAAARQKLLDTGFIETETPFNVARLNEIGPLPWYLAGFVCVLAAAGLLHQLTITLRRRRGDLSVARALGLPARKAASALTWQALITVLAGVVIGAAAGAVIGPVVWRTIAGELGVRTVTRFPVAVVPIAAFAGACVAALVSFGPRARATRLPLAATLRAE
jgi:ABC-type lipoprotein release transport system permease subunit